MVKCADHSLYTGVAKDLEARLFEHNRGKGAKYTRGRRPVYLVYQETAKDRGAALRREAEIKKMTRIQKQRLFN